MYTQTQVFILQGILKCIKSTFTLVLFFISKWIKIVIRRLPPSLTKEELEEQLQPLPDVDYLEFFSSDTRSVIYFLLKYFTFKRPCIILVALIRLSWLCSLYPHLFARAYLNFKHQEDIVLFRDRFDGYVFIDNRGK